MGEASVPAIPAMSLGRRLLSVSLASLALVFAFYRWHAIDPGNDATARVFASFWGAGWALSHGTNPFALTPYTTVTELFGRSYPEVNLNPPILLPLFHLLSWFDLASAARLVVVLSVGAYILIALRLFTGAPSIQHRQILWVFLTPLFYNTISIGQIHILLFAMAAAAWSSLSRGRQGRAGWAIGALIAVRPTFGLWIVLLWLAGHRRASATAAAVAVGLTAASVAIYGVGTFAEWLSALGIDEHVRFATNASLNGYLTRLGAPGLGRAASVVVAAGACAWAWRRRPDAVTASVVAVTASMLAAPLSWVHYALLLVPALLLRPWGPVMSAAALLLCLPVQLSFAVMGMPGWVAALYGGVYTAAIALVAADRLLAHHRESRATRVRPDGRSFVGAAPCAAA